MQEGIVCYGIIPIKTSLHTLKGSVLIVDVSLFLRIVYKNIAQKSVVDNSIKQTDHLL